MAWISGGNGQGEEAGEEARDDAGDDEEGLIPM